MEDQSFAELFRQIFHAAAYFPAVVLGLMFLLLAVMVVFYRAAHPEKNGKRNFED